MSHAVGRTRYSVEEFETEVAYDKPLGLDAYGYEEHIDGNIGEKEAESEQHAIDSTRSTNHGSVDESVEHCAVGVGVVIAALYQRPTVECHLLAYIWRQHAFKVVDVYGKHGHLNEPGTYSASHVVE